MKNLLNKIVGFIPKSPQKRDFLLLILVSILFLGYSISSNISKKQQIVPPQYLTNVLENRSLSISFSKDFNIPKPQKSLYIYEAQITSIPIAVVAANLAEELGFDPGSTFIGLWLSADKTRSVVANQLNKNVQYSTSLFQPGKSYSVASKPTLESATQSVLDFSGLIKELPPLEIIPDLTKYLKAGNGEFVVSNSGNYDAIELTLSQNLDSLPVRVSSSSGPILTTIVGPESRVAKAIINPNWVQTTTQLLQPNLFGQKEIENSIRQGQIMEINPGPEIIIHPYDLVQIEIFSATLEYHYFPLKRLLIPVYNLRAKVLTKNKIVSTAKIAVPAANTP